MNCRRWLEVMSYRQGMGKASPSLRAGFLWLYFIYEICWTKSGHLGHELEKMIGSNVERVMGMGKAWARHPQDYVQGGRPARLALCFRGLKVKGIPLQLQGLSMLLHNFNTQDQLEDNWIPQLWRAGWWMVMLGDKTWQLKLFRNGSVQSQPGNSIATGMDHPVTAGQFHRLGYGLPSQPWVLSTLGCVVHGLAIDPWKWTTR